jgi:protein TonB
VNYVRSFALLVLTSCAPGAARNVADSLPQLASDAVPFRYPLSLYEQRIEGDVTLRLHVDSNGVVVPDSLRIVESSGHPLLDSAAMQGAPSLQFRPARLGGRAVSLTVLFPVKFRVPAAAPPASDSSARIPDRFDPS